MRVALLSLLTIVASAASAERLSVVTWNLWHGFGPSIRGFGPRETPGARAKRVERQDQILSRLAPDVMFLQECNPLLERAGAIATRIGAEWSGQLDAAGVKLFGVGVPRGLDAGLATLGRPSYRDLGSISLTNPRFNVIRPWASLQVREERFAHFAEVRLASGLRVLLVNTQLHDAVEFPRALRDEVTAAAEAGRVAPAEIVRLHRRLSRGDRRRRRELGHLLARARELGAERDVTLIAGDLNAAPDSDTADVLRSAGFTDAWAQVAPADQGLTYDANVSALNRALQSPFVLDDVIHGLSMTSDVRAELVGLIGRFEHRARRIDYVWFSSRGPRVTATSAALVGEAAPGEVTSDHLGVAIELEITRER